MTTVNIAKIPDGPAKEAIRIIVQDLTLVQTQLGSIQEFVDHTICFDNHPNTAALAIQTRHVFDCHNLANPCGSVAHGGAGSPAASLDITVGPFPGASILAGGVPQPIGANPPNLPFPIAFVGAIVVPAGTPINYIINDGGGALLFPTVLVEWQKLP